MSGGRRGGGRPGSGSSNGGGSGYSWVEKKTNKSEKSVVKGQWAPCTSSNAAPKPATASQARNGNGSLHPPGNGWVQHSDHRHAGRGSQSLPQNKQTETKLQAPRPVVTAPPANGLQWVPRARSYGSESNKDDAPTSGSDPEMDNGEPCPVVTAPLANGLQWVPRSCSSGSESNKDDAPTSGSDPETDNGAPRPVVTAPFANGLQWVPRSCSSGSESNKDDAPTSGSDPETDNGAPSPVVTAPLANGLQWVPRSRSSGSESNKDDAPTSGSDPETDNGAPCPVVTAPLANGLQWVPRSRSSGSESNKDDAPTSGSDPETDNGAPCPVVTAPLANGLQWVPRSRSSGSESNKDDAPTSGSDPETDNGAPLPVVTAPLANGLQWVPRSRSSGSESNKDDAPTSGSDPEMDNGEDYDSYDDNSDDDMVDDTSGDFNSKAAEKNFETRKRHELLKSIFELLEKLSVEQINEKTRPWHCPACKNVRGGVAWYKGLQPLMNHARTKGSKRVKLHRELAALLEEELYRRGVSMAPSGEFFGIWKGLRENTDRPIVWPPVVIVMNTRLEQDKDSKWKGMGNQELLGYFSKYHVKEACHAYGPDGHSGMSALIFEGSAVAYKEAERLHNHFVDQRTDRYAWFNRRLIVPGGKRQLYGFLAEKEDMEAFNGHHGKDYFKYEMKSYNEMVVTQLKQMSEDNQQLNYVKNEMVKTDRHSKEVEEALGVETQKLQGAIEDNIILRRKTKEMLLECVEQMEFNAKFYHEQIERLRKDTEEKESAFERLLQEELAKAIECDVDSETTENTENCRLREERIQRIIDCQVKDAEEFDAEQDELIKTHEEKKAKVKMEYMAKDVELEEELYAALTSLMEKHKPDIFQPSSS